MHFRKVGVLTTVQPEWPQPKEALMLTRRELCSVQKLNYSHVLEAMATSNMSLELSLDLEATFSNA